MEEKDFVVRRDDDYAGCVACGVSFFFFFFFSPAADWIMPDRVGQGRGYLELGRGGAGGLVCEDILRCCNIGSTTRGRGKQCSDWYDLVAILSSVPEYNSQGSSRTIS